MDQSLEHQGPVVKPLRPLVYNFFVSQHPQSLQQTLEELDSSHYPSFHSQKLESKNGYSFRPTMQFKKLVDEPKFLLSVERKKIKIMKGISQKASSQRPSRSSYRGRKLRNTTKTINQEDVEQPEVIDNREKDKPIQSQQRHYHEMQQRKTKQPHLHFNLRHLIETRKKFTGDFSREENITGSNYPYLHYFSSTKSSLPSSQRSSRYKSSGKREGMEMAKTGEKKRFISTTVGVRTGICQNF